MSTPQRQEEEEEGINFFIPMVDLMVAVLFVFIIIIMVLVLLIREESAAAIKAQHLAVPKVPDILVINRTAVEQFVEDIARGALRRNGVDIDLEGDTMRATVLPPESTRFLEQ